MTSRRNEHERYLRNIFSNPKYKSSSPDNPEYKSSKDSNNSKYKSSKDSNNSKYKSSRNSDNPNNSKGPYNFNNLKNSETYSGSNDFNDFNNSKEMNGNYLFNRSDYFNKHTGFLYNSTSHYEKLKYKLMEEYKDWDLLDIEGSSIIENVYGKTLRIRRREKINFSLQDKHEEIKKELLSNLKIIPGIGIKKESELKSRDFNTLHDLLYHPKYSLKAQKAIDDIENECFVREHELLKELSKYPNRSSFSKRDKNKPIKALYSLDPFNLKFMDIETLGLSNVPIILLGIAEIKGDYIESNQYLIRDIDEEPALIEAYLSHIDEASVHVTFNGAIFDIPFIKNRADYFRMDYDLDQIHYDLIYPARNLWKRTLPNCKLTTIEKYLFGITREDDVPGSHIPNYYQTYLKENNIGPLIPIIEHNRMDIVSLASFLMKIYEESFI